MKTTNQGTTKYLCPDPKWISIYGKIVSDVGPFTKKLSVQYLDILKKKHQVVTFQTAAFYVKMWAFQAQRQAGFLKKYGPSICVFSYRHTVYRTAAMAGKPIYLLDCNYTFLLIIIYLWAMCEAFTKKKHKSSQILSTGSLTIWILHLALCALQDSGNLKTPSAFTPLAFW